MCGIAGFVTPGGVVESTAARIVAAMTDRIAPRGPDAAGAWMDAARGIVLGHRRLSILDLSPAGAQPMLSASGRFVIAFNGEIYNHLDIRKSLEDGAADTAVQPAWRGHSDTETLLAACERWGVRGMLRRVVGMFAIALWDREDERLWLARDRMGEKPLYYGWTRGTLVFASQPAALAAHPDWEGAIDRGAVALFTRYGYVPSPHSIYTGIGKLGPGMCVSLDLARGARAPLVPEAYWSLAEAVRAAQADPFTGTESEAIDALAAHVRTAVRGQLLSDVPLGAFLSGGVDSSTVVALMREVASGPVRTFTIGFDEPGYNEAEHAKAVARHLGTEHTELYVTPREAMEVIPSLPAIYDEPFADASQIPTLLLSRLARRQVTVALSGDGGDELFCGYTRYAFGDLLWRRAHRVPRLARSAVSSLIGHVPNGFLDAAGATAGAVLPKAWRVPNLGQKVRRAGRMLGLESIDDLHGELVSHWTDLRDLVPGVPSPPTAFSDAASRPPLADLASRMMYLDALTFLPDDVLVKVDRAAMAVSLETRVPLLDHRVVEFAWRLPQSMKGRPGSSKHVLRQLLYRHVPRALIERPKMGFGVPVGQWIRGPLREWAESLLDEGRLRREGWLEAGPIRTTWAQHLARADDYGWILWDVLMFQAWLEQARESGAVSGPGMRREDAPPLDIVSA
jgi:asparagine synthase (glutamine-hydrolysing)